MESNINRVGEQSGPLMDMRGNVVKDERRIRERIERLDQTNKDRALIEQLMRLISAGSMKVKVYTRGRLHAKAYIFDYPTGRFEQGIAMIGSSNPSLAGVQDNTELPLTGEPAVARARSAPG